MDHRIRLVVSSIERNFSRDLDSAAMGKLVNMSESRLRHLFKAETGLTLRQYLKRTRLGEAKTLLQTTFLSVKEVMNRVGMIDDSYFSREFKKEFGAAPGKFRRVAGRKSK